MTDLESTLSLIIFVISYIGIIFTRLPGVNIDRPSAAYTGAVAMVLLGVLGFGEAIGSIDFNTIMLLLGMMIVISVLEQDGFFVLIAHQTISVSKNPVQLLNMVVFVTGIASAFLVNDAVVLLFTPVLIGICKSVKVNPVPYLIAEIFASNIGSTMTITGNPQNMLIGINSGISFGMFMLYLAPVSLLGLLLIVPVIRLFFKYEFAARKFPPVETGSYTYNFRSMKWSVPIFAGITIAFFFSKILDLSIPVIALTGSALVLLFGKIRPSLVIRGIDWVLLLFFASLFILVYGFEKTGYLEQLINMVSIQEDLHGIAGLHLVSLVMSQVVSNVPFTVVMLPMMKTANSDILWLALASGSTLAGNATIIGAMANLIVIEAARTHGVRIRFMEFLKPGLVITLITLFLSVVILYLEMELI